MSTSGHTYIGGYLKISRPDWNKERIVLPSDILENYEELYIEDSKYIFIVPNFNNTEKPFVIIDDERTPEGEYNFPTEKYDNFDKNWNKLIDSLENYDIFYVYKFGVLRWFA